VGIDKYGNKYFENPYYFYGRNRWIEFAPHVNMDYDGSMIPAEWYGWMHYKVGSIHGCLYYNRDMVRKIIALHLGNIRTINLVLLNFFRAHSELFFNINMF